MNRSHKSNIELGDVVRRFGPAYIQKQGERLLLSQRKALMDIMSCHTSERGGHRYHCHDCGEDFWIYHGCCNRSCPSCHTQAMRKWINQREDQMLDCRYFHLVVTVPERIRVAFLAHQKLLYGLLMKTVSSCVMDLARDPKFLGATPAILMVLHTWRYDLGFHPHVHLLLSAGGVSEDGHHWIESRYKKWLFPVKALTPLVRRRFRARLMELEPEVFKPIDPTVWKDGWNSHCTPCGRNTKAVLNYLGRYVYRVAISNARMISMNKTHVTFRCKNSNEKRWQTINLPGEEFLSRFVMHVLPRGFHKVRYYGLWHHSKRETRTRICLLLAPKVDIISLAKLAHQSFVTEDRMSVLEAEQGEREDVPSLPICPHCQSRNVSLVESLTRNRSP